MADAGCTDIIAGFLGGLDVRAGSYDAGGVGEIGGASCQLLREGYAQVAGLGALLGNI